MATQITNYQCPACTGPLHFVGASGRLECDYCGSTFSVEEIEQLYADKEEASVQAAEQQAAQQPSTEHDQGEWDLTGSDDWGPGEGMRAYNCPSCGAELICDETTAATSCPYCGNPSIVPGQFVGVLRPDCIIPFKVEKNAAIAALKQFYHKKRLLPRAFTTDNHLQEIQGIYVPFWLFDGSGDVDVSYHATRSHTRVSGNYRITTTEHFNVQRAGVVAFEKLPVDASSKMPDAYMDSIEPFDYSELKDFSTAYLPGYLADKYDVSQDDCAVRADRRCRSSCLTAMRNTVSGYETVTATGSNVALRREKVRYALLPVWLLHTKWNGEDYLFSVNGQTGKLTGNLPVSKGRFWAWFAGIFAPLAAILAVLLLAI